jgi:hypothetical protein
MRVSDGSRRIFDTNEKYEGLKKLSFEMDDLVREVAREQRPWHRLRYRDPFKTAVIRSHRSPSVELA